MESSFFNNQNIYTMTSLQLLRALQTTKTYNMTQKQIVQQLGGSSVYILRPELKKICNTPKINLTFDNLQNIMLQADIQTLHHICLTNKHALQLCQSGNFWHLKFQNDNLPLLYEVPKENLLLTDKNFVDDVTTYIKHEPTTFTAWGKLYLDTQFYINRATEFVNYAVTHIEYNEFWAPEVGFSYYQWLPVSWFQMVHDLDEQDIPNVPEIVMHVNYNYYIVELLFLNLDDKYDIPESQQLQLSKEDFVVFLTKLFYYQSDIYEQDDLFIVNMSEDDPIMITIEDIKSNKSFDKILQ
jgi:hypothetical protein